MNLVKRVSCRADKVKSEANMGTGRGKGRSQVSSLGDFEKKIENKIRKYTK
jgi:hypothetical protein